MADEDEENAVEDENENEEEEEEWGLRGRYYVLSSAASPSAGDARCLSFIAGQLPSWPPRLPCWDADPPCRGITVSSRSVSRPLRLSNHNRSQGFVAPAAGRHLTAASDSPDISAGRMQRPTATSAQCPASFLRRPAARRLGQGPKGRGRRPE